MAGLLSGLKNLGLDFLEESDVFAQEKVETAKARTGAAQSEAPKLEEKDYIYDKQIKCPVCEKIFEAKIMKTGRAKLLQTDYDLRPCYEGVDAVKYDVLLCSYCGYGALSRYFEEILPAQKKLIKENISKNVKLPVYGDKIYTHEQALERYKLALACAVVKKAKISEKSYICLKIAWVLRGFQEKLVAEEYADSEKIHSLKAQEEEYLRNAYSGFLEARQKESFPICGMDTTTFDYLLAQLAFHFNELKDAAHFVQAVLNSRVASARVKDKALELKNQILKAMK